MVLSAQWRSDLGVYRLNLDTWWSGLESEHGHTAICRRVISVMDGGTGRNIY